MKGHIADIILYKQNQVSDFEHCLMLSNQAKLHHQNQMFGISFSNKIHLFLLELVKIMLQTFP